MMQLNILSNHSHFFDYTNFHFKTFQYLFMTTLIFKNKKLKGILQLTEQATTFRASFDESVNAYEKDTGITYTINADLSKYCEHHHPTIWLVKDEGIYLMTSAKLEKFPSDNSHICYAEGFSPETPGYWEKCQTAVGGDDFVESFRFNNNLRRGIKNGADILIKFGAESFTVELVYYS